MNMLDSVPHWQGQFLIQKTTKQSVRDFALSSLFKGGVYLTLARTKVKRKRSNFRKKTDKIAMKKTLVNTELERTPPTTDRYLTHHWPRFRVSSLY